MPSSSDRRAADARTSLPTLLLFADDIEVRRDLGQMLVKEDARPAATEDAIADDDTRVEPAAVERAAVALPPIDWSGHGVADLAPRPLPFPYPPPSDPNGWRDHYPLPRADVVVITWTAAEWAALHYVFANALAPLPDPEDRAWREAWYPYRRDFWTAYQVLYLHRLIGAQRNAPAGVPALGSARWGSFCLVDVNGRRTLLLKSDLHLNQDGEGLPLRQMVRQIIEDVRPSLVLSIGTSGGVRREDGLGDVLVTNSARFHLGAEFQTAAFNGGTFTSSWSPPARLLGVADSLLVPVDEYPVEPPTAHFPANSVLRPNPHTPRVKIVSTPILTTDFFEYGTTANGLDAIGCCVEMDDAVIAMELDAMNAAGANVEYGFLRNVSDPVITGGESDFGVPLQRAWAVLTYQERGFLTSFNGAIATWAMVAG